MFIGDLVKLKSNIVRNGQDKEFIENGIKDGWIWLIVSMDDEDLDYIIKSLYICEESNMIQLGGELLVTYDEIEKVELNRQELFKLLNKQNYI